MARLSFGTDGVRGRALEALTLDLAHDLGRAAAEVLGGDVAVVGRDTRESGPVLTRAIAEGLRAGGVQALDLGVAPTPAVAHAARARGAIGAMISASHNPWFDNGIKLFDRAGTKLADDQQDAIEHALEASAEARPAADAETMSPSSSPSPSPSPTSLADLPSVQPDLGEYASAISASIESRLDGLRVVVDAANGAASHLVGPMLADLGADVAVIANAPDGRNINDRCGSTDPTALAAAVVEKGADLGIALDGDADRLLTVDHAGAVIDGDRLMAILADDLHGRGRLAGDRLVVTVMSNMGLLQAMRARGIEVEVTPVGDRAVLDALDRLGASFGGEQSGHLVFADLATTGDGILSAVQLLDVLVRRSRPLAELAAEAMVRFPQVLRSVTVGQKLPDIAERIADQIAEVEARLGDDGRVLVRASGTEPVVRVMVEALDDGAAHSACEALCTVVADRFGAEAL